MLRRIKKNTYHAGASAERHAILRYLRRLKVSVYPHGAILDEVIDWIKARKVRYGKRKGGL